MDLLRFSEQINFRNNVMKYLSFFIILIIFLAPNNSVFSQIKTGKIIIEVSGFENNNGMMFAHLYNNESYFPKQSDKAFMFAKVQIKNKKAFVVFEDVPYGNYAITVHHDENNNGIMDKTWIGYPAEGFGLSNNPTIYLSVPSYDECKFKLESSELTLKIKLKFV